MARNMYQRPVPTWQFEEFVEGQCAQEDVGRPKEPEVQDVQEVLAALPPLDMAELRQSALRVARSTTGYDKFFEKYPGFLHKFLLVMARESTPPPQTRPMQPMPEVPWLTSQRLSYKRDAEQSDSKVRSTTLIEHRDPQDE